MKRLGKGSWKMSKSVWTKVRKKGRGLNMEVGGRSWSKVYHNLQGRWWVAQVKKEAASRTLKTISTRKNLNLISRIRNFPLRKADAWKAGTLSLGGEVKFYGALQLCPTSPHPWLFLCVIASSCSFKLGWSWIVSAQVSPRPSSSCV